MTWNMRAVHSRRFLGLYLLSILGLILLTPAPTVAIVENDDLTGVKVAIYNGAGVMISSRVALTRMFEWMNASVEEVNATQILDDILDDYDMLVIPGGSETICCSELQYIDGVRKIQDFVRNGGSYFGICGGATYGANYVDFFNGSMSPVSEPGSLIHMTTMNVNQSSTGPELSDWSANFATMYYGSWYFSPRADFPVHVVATYEYNDEAGMIAFEYGNGTVFLSSPHPEYEEDDDRDDTTDYDYLEDPDSEWDLLFRVSKWLIEASYVEQTTPTTPTPTPTPSELDLPLIAIASTGIVVVALTVAVLYRRMR
ncbi:MAG: BPL-N domain-containing protein [Candidatus Thorarchaeota archaeon]